MWNQLRNTFNKKRVLVTGHTGFKGAWLTQTLNLLGAEIMGYSLAPYYDNNLYELLELEDLCSNSIIGDIRAKDTLIEKIIDFQPEFIFHLAAQPLVRASYKDPVDTYNTNVMGTVYILDAIRQMTTPVTSILITTDKVYENNETGKSFQENDKLGGYDPYSSSKACCEIAISSYMNSFFNPAEYKEHQKAVASCRAGNVIGGGDWATDRLLPDIIRALKEDEVINIRSPHAIRPWQHVIEPVFFYLMLAMKLDNAPTQYAGAWNIGPDKQDILTVQEVVEKALSIWGTGKYESQINSHAPHEAGVLKLDCTKAKTILGWQPQLNADKAIAKTIEWYKANDDNPTNSKNFTIQQIMEYANSMNSIPKIESTSL